MDKLKLFVPLVFVTDVFPISPTCTLFPLPIKLTAVLLNVPFVARAFPLNVNTVCVNVAPEMSNVPLVIVVDPVPRLLPLATIISLLVM